MSRRRAAPAGASQYDRVAQASADRVIAGYSTSFGWASRLLEEPVRTHVRSIYALVRIADETVDDPDEAFAPADRVRMLDAYEAEVAAALACGRSTDLVIHAFALTARRHGIAAELIDPFFASMRADLSVAQHGPESFATYVHGSAEVVGLMCLRVFLDGDEADYRRLAPAASRLGAAFQKVNFLRDLAQDEGQLGRTYFPDLAPGGLDDTHRDLLLADIEEDLRIAATAIPHLPASSRRAVAAAHGLYSALADELRRTPAERIRRERVRVAAPRKARILARAVLGDGR